jgi:hypothetical protein
MASTPRATAIVPLLLVACGASGASPGTDASVDSPLDSSHDAATEPAPEDASEGGTDCGLDVPGSLLDEMTAMAKAMASGAPVASNALVVPTTAERDAFAQTVVQVLGGDESAACALPPSYRLVRMVDPTAGALRVVAEVTALGVPAPALFYGTYAAPRVVPSPSRSLVIEAPHPLFDLETELQATAVFVASASRWLLVAGAHRCADVDASACSGTTNACDDMVEPYRISDAAHEDALPFHAVHELLSDGDPTLLFLQLHGNGEPCPTALVSDCSGSWDDAGVAATLASELVAAGVGIGQCGIAYPTATCDLCGTDNVQARYTAGSPEACTQLGTHYGRFVHVEQQLSLRQAPDGGSGGYEPMIDAVLATFPAQ